MTFQSGEAWNGNRSGRKPGTRNKRTEEIFTRLEERGDKDPADLLSEIVSDIKEPKELRVQAANFLLPYKYGKCGTIPSLRYIADPVQLPKATTIEQANANIATISEMKSLGQIDLDFADSLIADNRTIANNLIAEEELKLKIANQNGGGEQIIHITGGLPQLPGTAVIFDDTALANGPPPLSSPVNGHNGHVIEHDQTESVSEDSVAEPQEPQT